MGRASVRPRLSLVAIAIAGVLAPPEARGRDADAVEDVRPLERETTGPLAEPADPPPTPSDSFLPEPPDEGPPPEPADPAQPEAEEPPPLPPPPAPPPAAPEAPGEPPPPAPPPAAPEAPGEPPPPAPPPAEKPAPQKAKEDSWLDVGHAFVEHRIFAPVLRLDRFFSDERDLEADRSRSFLRWRSELRWDETRDMPALTTGLHASLRFPGLNKRLERLRVIIAGETRSAIAALFPPEPGTETTPQAEETTGTADAELRFRLWETLVSHGDLGAGVLFRWPPGAFGRVRMRLVLPVKKIVLTRYVATGFWRTDTRFGTSAAVEAERPLGHMVLARLGGNGTLTQRSAGVEWIGEMAFLASPDGHSALQAGATVNGATRATPRVDRLRLYTRLRRDFYRRWLFFELEPDVYWRLLAETGRGPVWGITLRLEVQFQGNEKPVPPPAAGRREPLDPQ